LLIARGNYSDGYLFSLGVHLIFAKSKLFRMKTFSLTFFIRPCEGKEKDLLKIFARICVGGKRKDFSLNRKIPYKCWNPNAGKPNSRIDSNRELIKYLETVRELFYKSERVLLEKFLPVNAENLLQTFNSLAWGNPVKKISLMNAFDFHNKQMQELCETGEVVQCSVTRYYTSKKYLQEYINETYLTDDISLDNLQHSFIAGFDHWLRTRKKCSQNTVIKHIKCLRKVIRLSCDYGWIDKNPFQNYHIKPEVVRREYLDMEEIERIEKINSLLPRIEKVRDLFLFSCYTGLAYIDLVTLNSNDIKTDNQRNYWIIKPRRKTKAVSRIYLLPSALKLIKKYSSYPDAVRSGTLFPPISNQKLNAYLKEIADIAGIRKNITFHTARHTFATTITLSNGISLESVSAQLGHTSIRHTQHYAKMTGIRIGEEMKKLNSVFK
jgi:site-specific recombinase XerD